MPISKIAQKAAARYRRATEETPANPEMDEIDDLFSAYSDLYKEMHGIRPRFIDPTKLSLVEMKDEYDRLMKEYESTSSQRSEDISEREQREWEAKSDAIEKVIEDPYDKYLDDQSW